MPANTTPARKELLDVNVRRNGSGCFLYLKSDFDWSCLRNASGGTIELGGKTCYRMAPVTVAGMHLNTNSTIAQLYPTENKPNVTFLAAKGIQDGVEFSLNGPHSLDTMKKFKEDLVKFARAVYVERMKPQTVAVTLHIEEHETL